MRASQTLQLNTQQTQSLTPTIRQAFKLLQMPHLALVNHLHAAIINNPMLELEPQAGEQPVSGVPTTTGQPEGCEDITQWAIDPHCDSLKAHLMWQLPGAGLSPRDHSIGASIIEALDDGGLLAIDDDELTHWVRAELCDEAIPKASVGRVRALIAQLDPIGCAHRCARDTLLCQLHVHYPSHPSQPLAVDLLTHHLRDLAQGRHTPLCQRLHVPRSHLAGALALIKKLKPHPGESFVAPPLQARTPDAIIERHTSADGRRQWRVALNDHRRPILKMSRTGDALIRKCAGRDKAFLSRCQREGRGLINAMGLRDHTLHRVIDLVVHHQRAFLDGDITHPKPLGQKHVAQALGLSISTVSRTTRGKALQTPRGLIEMKSLFGFAVETHTGDQLSQSAVLARVQALISQEPPTAPLSDATIATHLNDFGVKITRRTVTKYRQRLGIRGSTQRRELNVGQWLGVCNDEHRNNG
ncbi:MAG: RNA polymerase factor sigma-54 [Wenzhouxiangella sp.]|nr:RNA polymerase factor sigma-54 [Wenzhouxiangella sp.]